MSRYGRQDGEPLVVDLTRSTIYSWDQLWDALTEPCGLPSWFGRNLNAWIDKRTGLTLVLTMTAVAHFMHHVYGPFDAPFQLHPPTT